MGTRQEEMQKMASSFFEKCFTKNIPSIFENYKINRDFLYQQFANKMKELFKKSNELYNSGQKGRVHYIVISYLLSGILTQNYDLKIDMYDEQFYLDEVEVSGYWSYHYFFSHFQNDVQQFEQYIRNRLVRVQSYEVQRIAFQYINDYLLLLIPLIREFVTQITMEEAFLQLEKAEDLQILFGGYLDKGMILYGDKEQKKEEI